MTAKLILGSLFTFGLGLGSISWSLLGRQSGLVWAGFGGASLICMLLFLVETEHYFWKLAYLAASLLLVVIAIGTLWGYNIANLTLK